MRTPRPFRWMESVSTANPGNTGKGRHAYPAEREITPGDTLIAICGERTTIRHHDHTRETPHPSCAACDRVWRDVEGISPPLRDHLVTP